MNTPQKTSMRIKWANHGIGSLLLFTTFSLILWAQGRDDIQRKPSLKKVYTISTGCILETASAFYQPTSTRRMEVDLVEFNPELDLLAVSVNLFDEIVTILWDTKTSKLVSAVTLDKAFGGIRRLMFSPNGNFLIVMQTSALSVIGSSNWWHVRYRIEPPRYLGLSSFDVSSSGQLLAVVYRSKDRYEFEVQCFALEDGSLIKRMPVRLNSAHLPPEVKSLSFTTDEDTIAIAYTKFNQKATRESWIDLYSLSSGTYLNALTRQGLRSVELSQIATALNRYLFVMADPDKPSAFYGTPEAGTIYVWDIKQGKLLKRMAVQEGTSSDREFKPRSFSVSVDGRWLAAAASRSRERRVPPAIRKASAKNAPCIKVWDWRTKRAVYTHRYGSETASIERVKFLDRNLLLVVREIKSSHSSENSEKIIEMLKFDGDGSAF